MTVRGFFGEYTVSIGDRETPFTIGPAETTVTVDGSIADS